LQTLFADMRRCETIRQRMIDEGKEEEYYIKK